VTTTGTKFFPGYEKPPINEVVCGILFDPLQSFLTPHVGLLWRKFDDDYPYCQDLAPLTPSIEIIDESPEIRFALSDIPPLPRVWFINASGNEIIQIQRDRFLHNWRKMDSQDAYPRYKNIIQKFKNHLSSFESFLKEASLEQISPLQYELTYVNHILQGEGWDTYKDVGKVFPYFSGQVSQNQFPEFEAINWRTTFPLPDRAGRLHVTIRNGIRQEDNRHLFVFELTARGIERDQSNEGMWRWFQLANEFIVNSFVELTDKEIQKNVWRYRG
jgi:uncharacterized protein (TIGR04255 family)